MKARSKEGGGKEGAEGASLSVPESRHRKFPYQKHLLTLNQMLDYTTEKQFQDK